MQASIVLPTVRSAKQDDEEEIMEMCRALHRENGLCTFDEGKVRDTLRRHFDRSGAIVAVIGDTGSIQASTCLLITSMYYTGDWHLEELWNYVDPRHRRSRNAEALIEYGKQCSDRLGIPLVTGIVTNRQMAEKVRLYRRKLGYPAGAFFVYGAQWNNAREPAAEDFWQPFETRAEKRARLRREKNGTN